MMYSFATIQSNSFGLKSMRTRPSSRCPLRLRGLLALVAATTLLAACGQKGPLVPAKLAKFSPAVSVQTNALS